MKTLYLDCFSGISGDMSIAALIDLGLSIRNLKKELAKLGLGKEYHLHVGRGRQQQVTGTTFHVHSYHEEHSHSHHHHYHKRRHSHGRSFAAIHRLIVRSKLSPYVKKHSMSLFRRIAVVEGKIHGVATEKVHFHEVGALDSIVDIIGVCILLEELAPKQILASTPCEGHGFVECAHGRFPVPTAATLELLKGIPMRQIDIPGELITPTGASILSEFVNAFVPMPTMVVQKIGYGLGSRTYINHPNVLRAILADAETRGKPAMTSQGTVVDVLETNVDDVSPELLAHAMARLFEEGARDVSLAPIQMKKGRPGICVTVLADPEHSAHLTDLLLAETGSFGMRMYRAERICLDREIRRLKTRLGPVEIKLGLRNGRIVSAKPEFESCRRLALRLKKPIKVVWTAVVAECSKFLIASA